MAINMFSIVIDIVVTAGIVVADDVPDQSCSCAAPFD